MDELLGSRLALAAALEETAAALREWALAHQRAQRLLAEPEDRD